MIRDMIIVFRCPKCNEENRFLTGAPKRDDEVRCPVCGKTITVNKVFIDEFNRIVKGLEESIGQFSSL